MFFKPSSKWQNKEDSVPCNIHLKSPKGIELNVGCREDPFDSSDKMIT